MKLSRALIWLFPVYLLAMQHAGLAHGLSHALDSGAAQERLAASDACTKCLSFAKLAHLLPSTGLPNLDVSVGSHEATDIAPRHCPVGIVAQRNRGPPEIL